MKREELKDKIYEILFRQIDVVSKNELCEATDEIVELWPLPPAEGAEEILNKYVSSGVIHENNMIAAMTEFATLHAQRIAEKMVEERLKEEGK